MKFQSLQIYQIRIPFRFSFKHALADRTCAESLLVRLVTESGAEGWGEAVPRAYLTGESVQSAWQDLTTRWWPALRELDFPDGVPAADVLDPLYRTADAERHTASFAALDLAVHDALARAAGLPLAQWLGYAAHAIRLSAPLGGSSAKSVRKKALLFRFLGFQDFKLKLGLGIDAEVTRAARASIGTERDLRADANAAWDGEEAVQKIAALAPFGFSSFEQPARDIAGLARVRRELGVRVMADESLCTLADAQELIERNAADLWNVRLAKIGGFCGLRAFLQLARTHGIGLHLGTLVGETSLLAAAGRIASGAAEFAHVEYGFPRLFLRGDPFRGGPAGYFGTGAPQNKRPGLGVKAESGALARITVEHKKLA